METITIILHKLTKLHQVDSLFKDNNTRKALNTTAFKGSK